MKKTVTWIVAGIGLSLFAAAYAGPTDLTNVGSAGANDQVVRSASIIITTYYSDATLTTQVGSCVQSTCPGTKGKTCTGTVTSFHTSETDTCQ
jgi:hypothetical protein